MLDGHIPHTQSSIVTEYCVHGVEGEHEHVDWCALNRNLPLGAFGFLVRLAATGGMDAFIHTGTSEHLQLTKCTE